MLTEPPTGIGVLERAATAGVVFLAAGSFALSYDALHQLAAVTRPLAWIWPLIIDGFIVTASLAVLHAVLTGRPANYPWLLVLAFSSTSVAFNVLHARPILVARVVAAIPPLTLVLSFELLMRQLRHRLTRAGSVVAISAAGRDLSPSALIAQDQSNFKDASETARVTGHVESARNQARALHQKYLRLGTRLTGRSLAKALGISDGYARRLLREIAATEGSSRERQNA